MAATSVMSRKLIHATSPSVSADSMVLGAPSPPDRCKLVSFCLGRIIMRRGCKNGGTGLFASYETFASAYSKFPRLPERQTGTRKAAGRFMAQSCRTLPRCGTATEGPKAEIIAAIPLLLTEAQSQGTKVASTVARDGKTEGISTLFRPSYLNHAKIRVPQPILPDLSSPQTRRIRYGVIDCLMATVSRAGIIASPAEPPSLMRLTPRLPEKSARRKWSSIGEIVRRRKRRLHLPGLSHEKSDPRW